MAYRQGKHVNIVPTRTKYQVPGTPGKHIMRLVLWYTYPVQRGENVERFIQ